MDFVLEVNSKFLYVFDVMVYDFFVIVDWIYFEIFYFLFVYKSNILYDRGIWYVIFLMGIKKYYVLNINVFLNDFYKICKMNLLYKWIYD